MNEVSMVGWESSTHSSLDLCKHNGFDRGAVLGLLVGVSVGRIEALATTLHPSWAGRRKSVSCQALTHDFWVLEMGGT